MNVHLNPYINFKNSAREALTFYHSVFGGELTISTYGESGMEGGDADKVMHGQIDAPNSLTLMASDAPEGMPLTEGSNISVSLSGSDEEALRGYWDGLMEGGSATMPLEQAPWGDTFGMLTNKFGVNWMVNISGHED